MMLVDAQIETNLWMTSGNRIVMVSPSSGNLSLTALATAEEEEAATVFVTELGPRGASIYRVTADQRSQQLLSPEDMGDSPSLQLESLVLERASSLLYLTSRSTRTIYSLDTKQSSAKLEKFYSSSSKS